MEEEEWLWILASVRCCLIVSEHLHPFIMMMMIWSVHFAPFCCLILYSFYFFNKMLPTLSITHIPIQRIKSQLPLLLCHLTSLFWVFSLCFTVSSTSHSYDNDQRRWCCWKWENGQKESWSWMGKLLKLFSKEGNSRKY